jgi:hypothetical protein
MLSDHQIVSSPRLRHFLLDSSTLEITLGVKHLFLVDPVVLSGLPALNLLLVEPEGNLLLRGVDGIGTMADVATDVL